MVALWVLALVVAASMPAPAGAMSSDQAETDTVTSICDEPGCACTAGRITCFCQQPNQRVVVSSLIPPTTSIIQLENCAVVEMERNALRHVRALVQIHISNVAELRLNEGSFSWEESFIQEVYTYPGLHINLTASTIPTLPTYVFRGRIDSILFDHAQIQRIESYAFTNIVGTEKIEFKHCTFGRVDTQAFKKLFLDKLTFTGGAFTEAVPSKAVLDLEIRSEFKIDGAAFTKLHSSAFKIARTKTFYLKNCRVNDTYGEAFHIKTTGPVFVLNNDFAFLRTGAFNGLRVDDAVLARYEAQEFIFENNTIGHYELDALAFNTSSFEPHLDRVKVDLPCSCANTERMVSDLIAYSPDYPHSRTKPGAKAEEFLWCQNVKDHLRYKMVKEFRQKTNCLIISTGVPGYLVTLGLVVVPLAALVLLYFFWWRRRRHKWLGVPTESPMKTLKNGKHDSMIVMPEGKTYRETELHVIIEKAEPIVEFVPEARRNGGQPPLTSDL